MSAFLARRVLPTSARAFSTSAPRSSFAKISIIGRLADSPEVQGTSTGQEVLKYVVGADSGPKDNRKVSWFRVASFIPEGPQRDLIAGLDKGTLVYVEGEASMSQYEDAEGKPRSALNIIQQKFEVLSPKKPQQ